MLSLDIWFLICKDHQVKIRKLHTVAFSFQSSQNILINFCFIFIAISQGPMWNKLIRLHSTKEPPHSWQLACNYFEQIILLEIAIRLFFRSEFLKEKPQVFLIDLKGLTLRISTHRKPRCVFSARQQMVLKLGKHLGIVTSDRNWQFARNTNTIHQNN